MDVRVIRVGMQSAIRVVTPFELFGEFKGCAIVSGEWLCDKPVKNISRATPFGRFQGAIQWHTCYDNLHKLSPGNWSASQKHRLN